MPKADSGGKASSSNAGGSGTELAAVAPATAEELHVFASDVCSDDKELSQITLSPPLLRIIYDLANTGSVRYVWSDLQVLLAVRLENVLSESNASYPDCKKTAGDTFDECKARLACSLSYLDDAPFTIQRFAEILQEPHRHAKSTFKLLYAIERLLSVSTTIPLNDGAVDDEDVQMEDA